MINVRIRRIRLRIDRVGATEGAKKAVRRPVLDVTRKIHNACIVGCPVDSGNLRGQHSMSTHETATRVRGKVTNNAKYAAAVHDGSRAHIIRARRRRALAFDGGGWDGMIVVRSVHHPGTRAQPWMRQAAAAVAVREGCGWVPGDGGDD